MNLAHLRRVCLVPRLEGVGGMVSFQHKLSAGLAARGVEACFDLRDEPYAAVLVIGGTRRLADLWRARRRGVPIVQRLNGMNWLHRVRRSSLRRFLRAESANLLLATIRSRIAHRIVYQSEFSRRWWERARGPAPVPNCVVYNGVDLGIYSPAGPHSRPPDRWRLLMVEGSLMGGYELGLEVGVELASRLAERLASSQDPTAGRPVELMIAGRVEPALQRSWDDRSRVPLRWAGLTQRELIPELDRSAHLLYSADINAACPNSVIEALACGLPVLSLDTGALGELVTGDSGRVTPYGGDPWQLDPPDVPALVEAAEEILRSQDHFRAAARARAESTFGLDEMVASYLEALFD